MKSIAVITARSGSKGLPDKNIINLQGKPLMYYTIRAAIESGCFDTVMVSTDSEKYAQIARECGAEVPFLRSEQTSGDCASSWDTIREVLCEYKKIQKEFDYVALMQPTSPLRNADDVKGAYEFLKNKGANNVVTVTEVEHPVQWCFALPENNSMSEFAKSPYAYSRRQDLEKHYRENGSLYIVRADKIVDREYNFYADDCFGYVMPPERSIDIDTKFDLSVAELYMSTIDN